MSKEYLYSGWMYHCCIDWKLYVICQKKTSIVGGYMAVVLTGNCSYMSKKDLYSGWMYNSCIDWKLYVICQKKTSIVGGCMTVVLTGNCMLYVKRRPL